MKTSTQMHEHSQTKLNQCTMLTLLHSELYGVLAVLSAIGLTDEFIINFNT